MRYLTRWVICLGGLIYCNVGGVSAADSLRYGLDYLNLNDMVTSITADDELRAVKLTLGDVSVSVESANPIRRVVSKNISTEGYSAAVTEEDVSLIHDIAMRLLVNYEAGGIAHKKAELGKFLGLRVDAVVESAKQNFQRDYIILWQAYVFYMKMVPSINKSFFFSYSQKAYNLANAHEDENRATFVVKLFLDRLTANVGNFIAKEIIDTELKNTNNPGFLKRVSSLLESFGHRMKFALPTYQAAVETLPPPYGALQ